MHATKHENPQAFRWILENGNLHQLKPEKKIYAPAVLLRNFLKNLFFRSISYKSLLKLVSLI